MIGIDIIKIERISTLQKRFGKKALERFLNEKEIALVRNDQTAAGFWAAKEAFSKALGTGIGKECAFKDIQIAKTPTNKPYITVARRIIDTYALKSVELSITHDDGYAIAVVVLESHHDKPPIKGF